MAGNQTRRAIEEAAITVLSTQGLDGFTAANLARAAGVSKANLYHHFDGLDAILVASFERMTLGMAAMSPGPGTDLRDWLTRLGEEVFGVADDRAGAFRAYIGYFTRAMFDDGLRSRVAGAVGAGFEAFTGIIATLDPDIPRDERAARARLVMASLDGLLMYLQVMPERAEELHAAWRAQVDLLASDSPAKWNAP